MKYIFEVYKDGVCGIIEVVAKDDQEAIKKVNGMGLKFSSMKSAIGIYKIQYAMQNMNRWKL